MTNESLELLPAQQQRCNKAARLAEYQLQLARDMAERANFGSDVTIVAALLQAIATNFAAYTVG